MTDIVAKVLFPIPTEPKMPLGGSVKTGYFSRIAATRLEAQTTIEITLVALAHKACDRYSGYQIQLLH